MISIELYRARIGRFYSAGSFSKTRKSMKLHNPSKRKYAMILLFMIGTLLCLSYTLTGPVDICVSPPVSYRIIVRENVRNTNYSFRNWNKLMHCYNGNKRNILKVGHWNGGPSHLGRQGRGYEKMESIKELLTLHNLDAMGISEANIELKDREIRETMVGSLDVEAF